MTKLEMLKQLVKASDEDINAYWQQRSGELSEAERLKFILNFALKIKPEELAVCLDCKIQSEMLLRLDIPLVMNETEKNLCVIVEFLNSCADYRLDDFPFYWEEKNIFSDNDAPSKHAPPWDREGLHKYLTEKGKSGIDEASTWIKSNS